MNRSCIIFACTIISENKLSVLHRFLESFKLHFSDCDIFIGINSVSLDQIESIINSYKLNVVSMQRCKPELYSYSDASAYQVALEQLLISENSYDNYWFIHTKGGVNDHSNYLREWYIDNFLANRHSIEKFMDSKSDIGSYGMLGLEFDPSKKYNQTDCDIDLFNNVITSELPYTHAHFFYIHTIYVIKKAPVEKFLSLISSNWFNTKLDRYYFEGIFPFIVSRTGYFPYIENRYSCSYIDLRQYIERWIIENKLEKFKDYIDMFKTNYLFDQLYPPYVNSNT